MVKKKPILILFIVIIGVLCVLAFFFFKKDSKYQTDVAKLYSSLSINMKDFLAVRLSLLDCEPEKYYDDGSQICFLCQDKHVCFGYAWDKEGKMELAPPAPYFEGVNELTVEIGDFCYQGLASLLGCQKNSQDSLDCGEINFLSSFPESGLRCQDISLILKEGAEFEVFVRKFCQAKDQEQIEEIRVEEKLPGFPEEISEEDIKKFIEKELPDFSIDISKEEIERFQESKSMFFCGNYGIGLFKNTGQITIMEQ